MKKLPLALIIASGLLLALTACGSTNPTPSPPGPTLPASGPIAKPGSLLSIHPVTSPEALTYCPQIPAKHIFQTNISLKTKEVKVIYICNKNLETGEDVVQQVTAGTTNLLTAYSRPNDSTEVKIACPAMLADPLIIWVVNGGTPVPIYAPVTSCGFPQDRAAKAYQDAQKVAVDLSLPKE